MMLADRCSFSLPLSRSYSPRDRSPRRRSLTPPRGRSYSKSPPYRRGGRDISPYANG